MKDNKIEQGSEFYEIYQLKRETMVDYEFRNYKVAEKQLRASHYRKMYMGRLEPQMSLEDIYCLHNRDDRPYGDKMRSLSVSDIVVLHNRGKVTAHYVDSYGFKELPGFASKLECEKSPTRISRGEER